MNTDIYEQKLLVAIWFLLSGHGSAEEISKVLEVSRKQLLEFAVARIETIKQELQEEIEKI